MLQKSLWVSKSHLSIFLFPKFINFFPLSNHKGLWLVFRQKNNVPNAPNAPNEPESTKNDYEWSEVEF